MAPAVSLTEAALTSEEWRILSALRDIPPGPLRDRFLAFVLELADVVQDPHCSERQADGAPCMTVSMDCVQCHQIDALLAGFERRLRQG